MDALQEARDAFGRLSRADSPYGIKESVKRIRTYLAEAKVDAAALDVSGKKTAAQMEQEISRVAAGAVLEYAREDYRKLVDAPRDYDLSSIDFTTRGISESLTFLGKDASVLDQSGQMSAAEVNEKISRAIPRHCLNTARQKYNEYVTSNIAGWADLTDHIEGQINSHLEAAGAKLEDLDPNGATTRAAIEERMAETRRRLNLLQAREMFKDYETSASAVYADHPEALEQRVRRHLDLAGETLPALDPSGKSTVASIEERFRKTVAKVRLNGAAEQVQALLTSKDKGSEDTLFAYRIEKASKLLAAVPVETVSTDRNRKETRRSDVAAQLLEIQNHYPFARLCNELAEFEKIPTPRSLAEVREAAARLTKAFNESGMRQLLEARDGKEALAKVQMRIDDAAHRACDDHCRVYGRIAVMKPLRLGLKTG